MNKRLMSFFLCVLLLCSLSVPVGAVSGWRIDSGCLYIEYQGDMPEYGKAPWIKEIKSITKISVGESVKSLSEGAFIGCDNVTEVVFPGISSIKTIKASAFSGLSQLEKISLPRSLREVGDMAFSFCDKLDTIEFGGTSIIGDYAFCGCTGLRVLSIPSSIGKIGVGAFSLTGTEKLDLGGSSLLKIEGGAFANNPYLSSIIFPEGLKRIEKEAFFRCNALTELHIPDSVIAIGERAFDGCTNFHSVFITNPETGVFDKNDTFDKDTKIFGPSGSEAVAYGRKYGFETGFIVNGLARFDPKAATCTKDGNYLYFYDWDNHIYYKDENRAEKYINESRVTPSGSEYRVNQALISAKGHKYSDDFMTLTPATYLEHGKISRLCTVCGEKTEEKSTVLPVKEVLSSKDGTVIKHSGEAYKGNTEFYAVRNRDAEKIKELKEANSGYACAVYNLSVRSSGIEKQPASLVLVVMELPQGFSEKSGAYMINEEGKNIRLNSMCAGGKISFETTALGNVAIADESREFLRGDTDGNFKVSSADARMTLRAAVSLEKLTELQKIYADADKNEEITSADARIILRAAVGLEKI